MKVCLILCMNLEKLSAKRVPRSQNGHQRKWVRAKLTDGQKRNRTTISKQYLDLFKRNLRAFEFFEALMTVNETWVSLLRSGDERTVKIVDFKRSWLLFWGGFKNNKIVMDYLEKGKIVTRQYYAFWLDIFHGELGGGGESDSTWRWK